MLAELIQLHTQDNKTHFGGLYMPEGEPKAIGVVFVHGMTGSFVGEMESVTPTLVAKAGYASLVANNRGTGYKGAATEDFAGCVLDIAAALDFMTGRGFEQIALLGHSKGGVKVAYYLSKTHDPRVVGLGLLSPAENVHGVPVWMAKSMGHDDIEQFIPTVRQLVESGQDDQFLTLPEWPYFVSAATFLDHYTTTGDDVLPLARSFKLPLLALCGELEIEWCVPVASLMEQTPANVRALVIPGADHVYTNKESVLADVIVDWLGSLPDRV